MNQKGPTQQTPGSAGGSDSGTGASEERGARVLLATAEPAVRRRISAQLVAAGYQSAATDSASAALDACVQSRPHVVIADLAMPAMGGLALLQELKSRWPDIVVIVLTRFFNISQAVQATQSGAFSFLVKPVERAELLDQVKRAVAVSPFEAKAYDRKADAAARGRLMDERIERIARAAASDLPLLLTGENGTGKELLARAIHAASARRHRPFVLVRCGTAVESWLEEELFGRRVAVGASDEGQTGAIHAARDATLFVEEVGNLPARLQQRFMQVPADVRLICTTSCDLGKRAAIGQFSEELCRQLSALQLEIPPLGRRREDIPLIISYFLEQASDPLAGGKLYSLLQIEHLATTSWPESVRQLFDLVRRSAVLSGSRSRVPAADSLESTFDEAREQFSREYLAESLRITAGNVSKSARIAKRNRTDFYKLLARYRLRPDDYKNSPAGHPHPR